MKWLIALALGTLVSEDLTCITAGQFIRVDRISAIAAIAGCFIGIFVGDLGLWAAGRLLKRCRFVERRIRSPQALRFGEWFDRNSAAAILCSRFIPGSRLPMYLAAGALGRKPLAFIGWTLVAASLWTPLVVLSVAALGDALANPLHQIFGNSWIVLIIASAAGFLLLNLPRVIVQGNVPARVIASISKTWRWEFWPAWVFYLPLVPWIAWLALRHRSFMIITAANPGIPHGGVVGESKIEILGKIAGAHVLPARSIDSPEQLDELNFPLVLKPNAGQRGASVRIVHTIEQAREYFRAHRETIIAQTYHPGPFEAGIFYYRMPGESRGRIFSITDKHFPIVTGDGRSTLRDLIYGHPRFRMQAKTFFARHAADLDRVLNCGERFQLAHAGNHCQGTRFADGSHLITPQLERAIDAIAHRFDGFHFGRFDVRYGDVEAFKAGADLAVVELNGLTSESTNVYDPSRSIVWAYATLYRQWSLLFKIAGANRRRGRRASRVHHLLADVIRFYREMQPHPLSD